MSVLSFFEFCYDTSVAQAIRDSLWLFPVIEAIHLLALAVLGGAVLIVDLRLCGLGLGTLEARDLSLDVQPWLVGSLTVMLVTGGLLFASEALKCYENAAFWAKMAFLFPAILFTFTVKRRTLAAASGGRLRPLWQKAVAMTSLVLWTGVGAGGRAIGFY